MAVATWDFRIDWDRDGTFETGAENVTANVLGASVFIDRGMDTSSGVAAPMVGGGQFSLANDDSEYHPENSGSAVFANLVPGRQVRVQATHNAVTYDLLRGSVQDYGVDPNPGSRRVAVECVGAMGRLVTGEISTEVLFARTTGELVDAVLDAAGWPAGRRVIDVGSTVVPVWWVHAKSPWVALQELVLAEGPGAFLFESGAGDIVFHDRQHRVTATRSNTSQATFRATGTEPTFQIPMGYRRPWEAVVNDVTIPVEAWLRSERGVVWAGQLRRDIAATESVTFRVELDEPAYDVQTPQGPQEIQPADYGYIPNTLDPNYDAPASVTMDRTSGQSFAVTFEAETTTRLNVTLVQLRGRVLAVSDAESKVTDSDATSITAYERSGLSTPPIWCDEPTAEAVAATIIHNYKDPHPRVTIRVTNGDSTRYTAALAREINDRITVIDADAGMSRDFWVERITHEVTAAGRIHATVLEASAYVAPPVAANEVFIFDHATQGKFNTGKFGL